MTAFPPIFAQAAAAKPPPPPPIYGPVPLHGPQWWENPWLMLAASALIGFILGFTLVVLIMRRRRGRPATPAEALRERLDAIMPADDGADTAGTVGGIVRDALALRFGIRAPVLTVRELTARLDDGATRAGAGPAIELLRDCEYARYAGGAGDPGELVGRARQVVDTLLPPGPAAGRGRGGR